MRKYFLQTNPITLILVLFLLSLANPPGVYSLESISCGVLYSEGNYTGNHLSLSDDDHIVDIFDDHRLPGLTWNGTKSIKLERGCQLEICKNTYLDGICSTLEESNYVKRWSNFHSAKCTCTRECRCEDIFMKKSTCARAYLKGGCRTCNTMYTDILQGESDKFPLEYETKVEAFRVRKGCSVRLFEEEHFYGNEVTISDEISEDFNGNIRSSICKCNDDEYEPRPVIPRNADYPPLINIPKSIDDVVGLLTTIHKQHVGLIAAHKSLKKKRSSKNAYILLLGATGAGKSSAINVLFDNPNVTVVGDGISTTAHIHEFRIPVPVDELGVANSELRVIDTPGLGDTNGLTQDANFLATLDSYLATHEELKDRLPNVVLIFNKFTDNRFVGVGSNFVKMLRGLSTFRNRITDADFSNVIFVLSHFASASKDVSRRPESRLRQFKETIENYSLFPKPILISLAENKAHEAELPSVNGYHKLPNNEYYPRNLFEKLELVTKSSEDLMGQAIFRTAFRNSENFNVSCVTTNVTKTNPKAGFYLQKLSYDIFINNDTEVSKLLEQAYDQLPQKFKSQHHQSLQYIRKMLNLRNIFGKDDVPKTTTQILDLLTSIKVNEASAILLENALNLKAPPFPPSVVGVVAGQSYNVFKDSVLLTSPIKINTVKHSDIGFKIPQTISCEVEAQTSEKFFVFKTKKDYIQKRQNHLNIEASIIEENKFNGEIKPGYNIREQAFKASGTVLSATREQHVFTFTVNDRLDLKEEFVQVVKSLTPFNSSDFENVEKWQRFFNEYGTHIVNSVHGGGSIEIHLTSDRPFNSETGQALMDLIKFAEDMTFMMTNIDETSNKTVLQPGVKHVLKFNGGDPQYHTSDLTKLSIEDASKLLENWKKSLKHNPVMLTTEMKLLPLSHVVRKLGQNYTKEIERATKLLFNSSLVFNSTVLSAAQPPPREDTPMMLEMIKMIHASQAELNKVVSQMKTFEKQIEANKQKRIDETDAWIKASEAEKKIREEKFQKEMAELIARIKLREEELIATINKLIADRKTGPGSCLKSGTKILMADGSEKIVETLVPGNIVLDMDMMPTKVVGVSFEFLADRKFYGFDNSSQFFTDTHIFVGPDAQGKSQLYAKSTSRLFSLNPLMEYLNVAEMGSTLDVFRYNNNDIRVQKAEVVEDATVYPGTSKVYFLQVDSPSGTYFANGYVTRHEIPPVERWPNTMGLLFAVVNDPIFDQVGRLPYTLETVTLSHKIVQHVTERVNQVLDSKFENNMVEQEQVHLLTLNNVEVEKGMEKMFSNPIIAEIGMGLYANVGRIVSSHLDIADKMKNVTRVAIYQRRLFEQIVNELTFQIKNIEHDTLSNRKF